MKQHCPCTESERTKSPLSDWQTYNEWEAGLCLYVISSGDAIYLNHSGQIERWNFEGSCFPGDGRGRPKTVILAESFDEFIQKYIEHLSFKSWDALFW
jgi:hypothetical protein